MSQLRPLVGATLAGTLLLAMGCDGSGGPAGANVTSVRGAARSDAVEFEPNAVLPGPAEVDVPAHNRDSFGQGEPLGAGGAGSAGGGSPATVADQAPPEDVLGNALRTSFGTPTDCISEQTRESLHGILSITVAVRVLPSGRVLSSTVTGRGLSSADLACMRARAEGIHLPGPVENAPRNVMATVRFDISSTPGTIAEPEAPPERTLGAGAVGAGSTLPPGGTESERPRGFVAPSSTLPAAVE